MTNEEMVLHIQDGENRTEYLEQLYGQNKGLIHGIIKRYIGIEPEEDLMQEGYIGLQRAAELYEQNSEAKFSTYAALLIAQTVQRHIDLCGSLIKIPTNKRMTISYCKKAAEKFRAELHREPTQEELFCILGMKKGQADKIREAINSRRTRSLSEPIAEDPEALTLEETIKDPENKIDMLLDELEHEALSRELWKSVDELESEQAEVIRGRFKDGKTLEECGKDIGRNAERTRQIQMKALRKLRSEKVRNRLRPFIDERIYSIGLKGTGLSAFRDSGMSSVERAAFIFMS